MISHKLEFTGMINTPDRVIVGDRAYDIKNARVDRGKIEPEQGYSVQIPGFAGKNCWGGYFARWEGCEEFITVIGNKVYVAGPGDSAWTEIASGVSESPWHFQQYGNKVYAVNEADGIRFHTICDTDWTGGNKPDAPSSSGISFEVKQWRDGTTGVVNSLKTLLSSATWSFTGFTGTLPTVNTNLDYGVVFNFNMPYVGFRDFAVEATFSQTDLRWNDVHLFGVILDLESAAQGIMLPEIEFRMTADGNVLDPLMESTDVGLSNAHYRHCYFLGNREKRQKVTKLRWRFRTANNTNIKSTDKFTLFLKWGDTWMNDVQGFVVDDGPTLDEIEYAYSSYVVSSNAESDLDNIPAKSPFIPQLTLGAYLDVSLAVVSGSPTPDKLRLYRKRKSDKKFVFIGEVPNSGTPTISDHYMEWELESLDVYSGGHNLPLDKNPVQIGATRSSLCVAADYDLYISRVGSPLEFEKIDEAPDPFDTLQGRSVFVDDSRSEKVNAIHGGKALFLSTRSRSYIMFGDTPRDMSVPQAAENLGAIGPRASCLFKDGMTIITAEGAFLVRFGQFVGDNEGSIDSFELTRDIIQTVSDFNFSESAVAFVQRGELFLVQGKKYIRFERKHGRITRGEWDHEIVAAAPDYKLDLRLFTKNGALLVFDGSADYAGVPISWFYETGDMVFESKRVRLANLFLVAEGTPKVTVTSYDGVEGSSTETWYVNSDFFALNAFEGSRHIGSKFRLRFEGTQTDSISMCVLEFELMGGGKGR